MCIRDRYTKQSRKLNNLKLNNKHSQNEDIQCNHVFYPRISNLTSINFNNDELNLLNKGINYCIPPVFNNYRIAHELISAETAVKAIADPKMQDEACHLINNRFKRFMNTHMSPNSSSHLINNNSSRESYKILKQIKTKLHDNNAIICKADKGRTLVIMDNVTSVSYTHLDVYKRQD